MCVLTLNRARLFAAPCTAAQQVTLSSKFPRQEYWTGLPLPSPGDLYDSGLKAVSPASPSLQADYWTIRHRGVKAEVVVQRQVAQSCPALCDSLDCSPQAPLPVALSRQDHWRGVPCPPPGVFPTQPTFPVAPAL